MHDAAELDHSGNQLEALASIGQARIVVQRGDLRRVVGEDRGATVIQIAHVRARDRAVVEPENTVNDPVQLRRQMDRAGVAAILDGAAVRLLPAESLEVDTERRRELPSAAAHHHAPRRRVLERHLQSCRRRPAHHAIPVGRVIAMARGQLVDVQVSRAPIGQRLQPGEALGDRRSGLSLPDEQCHACIGLQLGVGELAQTAMAGTRADGRVECAATQRDGVGHGRPLREDVGRAPPLRRRCIPTRSRPSSSRAPDTSRTARATDLSASCAPLPGPRSRCGSRATRGRRDRCRDTRSARHGAAPSRCVFWAALTRSRRRAAPAPCPSHR